MKVQLHPLFSHPKAPAGVTLDEVLIQRLEADFARLKANPDRFVQRIYELLFSRLPEVRGMFPEDMTAQRRKMIQTLDFVVSSLRSPAQVQRRLADLGARHAGIGVKPEHYPIVARAIVDAMADSRDGEFPEELRREWEQAFSLIGDAVWRSQREAEERPGGRG